MPLLHRPREPPECPYCRRPATFFASSAVIYGRDYGPLWVCREDEAWVGCHPGTQRPLGRLADAQLRRAKVAAHNAFDPLWRTGRAKRAEAYRWLAEQLGVPKRGCHIGMFDVGQCVRVVEICNAVHQAAGED